MYRTINVKFWTDPYIKSLKPEVRLLYLYLITNPHTHPSGIYVLGVHEMVHETGLSEKEVRYGIDTLSIGYKVRIDTASETVYLPKMSGYQMSGPKATKCFIDHSLTLHPSVVLHQFCNDKGIPYPYPIDTLSVSGTGLGTGLGTGEEQSTVFPEAGKNSALVRKPRTKTEYTEEFNEFWKKYPCRDGCPQGNKMLSFAEWGKLTDDDRKAARESLVLFTGMPYMKDCERFLKYRQWESPPGKGTSSSRPSNKDVGIVDEESRKKMLNLW